MNNSETEKGKQYTPQKQKILIKFGSNNEIRIKPILEKFFDCKLIKTREFDRFDFYSSKEKIIIEVKGRRHKKDKYSDTMISKKKLDIGKLLIKNGYKVFLVFSFFDGDFYYQYDGNKEFRSEKSFSVINSFIPISELIKI